MWAPKDLGLFSKYGFNGDVVLVPGSVRQIQAVLGGSIHLAQIDAATGINAISQGADYRQRFPGRSTIFRTAS